MNSIEVLILLHVLSYFLSFLFIYRSNGDGDSSDGCFSNKENEKQ